MLRRKRKPAPVVPLGEAVVGVAACPCNLHQDSFVVSLAAAGELILRVMDEADPDVEVALGGDEEVPVATAVAPDGKSFLQAFTDRAAAAATYPGARFVAVPPERAFRLALSNGTSGLLVRAGETGNAWAAVTADGLTRLLDDGGPPL